MTTLQTHSTHSTSSAALAGRRAQLTDQSATNAQSFAGVLDAFVDSSDDAAREPKKSIDQSPEETDKSINQDSEGNQSDDLAQVDPDEAQDAIETEKKASTDLDNLISASTQRINSSADLAGILSNAASIDLANLATQQLQGQAPAQPRAETDTSEKSGGAQSTQPEPNPQPQQRPTTTKLETFKPQTPQQPVPPQTTESGPLASQSDSAAVKPNQQQQTTQPEAIARQPQQAAIVQASQISQAQASVASIATHRPDPIRTISDIVGAATKARAITGSESIGKTGSQGTTLDLGSRSQHTAQLTDPKPTNDRALQRQQIMSQVQRGLASIMNTKGGTMKLRLSPEHLGQVNIQLTTKDGHVRISIAAQNDQARSMLNEGLEGLRTAMESRGVQVDDLSIESRQQSEFERLFGDANQNGTQDRGSRDRHNSNNQPHHNADTNGDAHPADAEQHDSTTPQGIWTKLGLDAIA